SSAAREEYANELGPLAGHPNVVLCRSTSDALAAPPVLVAVARKWSWHTCSRTPGQVLDRHFEVGVVDEAFQMQTGELVRFGGRIDRLVTIGDPGQLEPFTTVESLRWAGLDASPIAPAPRSIAARRADEVMTFDLPASLRLD